MTSNFKFVLVSSRNVLKKAGNSFYIVHVTSLNRVNSLHAWLHQHNYGTTYATNFVTVFCKESRLHFTRGKRQMKVFGVQNSSRK